VTPLSVLVVLEQEPTAAVVVHVIGEVDADSAHVLTSSLEDAMDGSRGAVIIDCARWTFVDAAGLRVLLWFAREATAQDRLPMLRNLRPSMHHLLHLSGVDAAFPTGMAGYRA
jgi:anti-anti-sigma factor